MSISKPKFTLFRILFLVTLFGLTTTTSSQAQCPPKCPVIGTIQPKAALQITEPLSATLLEHSTIEIPYTVTLSPGVGETTPTINLVVCGADLIPGECDV
jgi:hypothetical protein